MGDSDSLYIVWIFKMRKPTFEKCCFCVNQRVGCFIIAYCDFIRSIISVTLPIGDVFFERIPLAHLSPKLEILRHTNLLEVGVVGFLDAMTAFLLSVCLIVGLHKNCLPALCFYLTYATFMWALYFILFVVAILRSELTIDIIALMIPLFVFVAYLLLVIRSYYYRTLEEQERLLYGTDDNKESNGNETSNQDDELLICA